MALEQRLNLSVKQTLNLRMTPQLRQAIKILQVSRPELESMVSDELCQNPTLEEAEGMPDAGEYASRTGDIETSESEPVAEPTSNADTGDSTQMEKIDWDDYVDRYSGDFHGSVSGGSDRDDGRTSIFENTAKTEETLTEVLEDELNIIAMSEEERRIGRVIVNNLNSDGYLSCSTEELAFMAQTTVEMIDEVREIVQELEPVGCGCINLRECLLIQLKLQGYEPDDYVIAIVNGQLKELEARRYDRIAKTLGCNEDEVVEAHKIIRSLEPKPGSNYGQGETRFIQPDCYVHKVGDDLVVTLNEEGLPALRVSPYYEKLLKTELPPGDARGYIQEKVRAAVWMIRSIEQRQRTLRKVTESIVSHQREFFLHGVQHLKPMVLKDVANDIGMHESTVSRATSNKYVQVDRGLYELKYFFTSSLKGTDGSDFSSESVKEKIQKIIGKEDPRKPLSDQVIAAQLAKEHVDIARRTVAKYREFLGILPSSKRKRYKDAD